MPKTVMFVDDDDVFLLITRHACRKIPEVELVIEATDGESALTDLERRAREQEPLPNVAFVDINMPRLDGFGFLIGISELTVKYPVLAGVRPIAMLTSSDQERDKTRALELGADEYIVKSANLADIRESICSMLS
jgi:CheY-like chemotaxis protein